MTGDQHETTGMTGRSIQAIALAVLGCVLATASATAQTTPIPNGLLTAQAAAVVIGQKNFSDITSASTNERLGAISGLAIAGNKLIVVDSSYLSSPNNNRVVIYNDLNALKQRLPQSDLPAANVIVGQSGPSQTAGGTSATQMFQPSGAATDGTRLFVAEWGNNRVLVYNQIPTSDGAAADLVIGQSSFTTSGFGTSTTALRRPNSVATDGTRLFIADTLNNRVLIYNAIPTANGAAANVEIGQPGFTTFSHLPTAANTLFDPTSATTDGTRLIVTDLGNNRVLIYNHIPTSNNAAADVVVGQPNFTGNAIGNTATTLSFPRYAFSDGTRLLIVDSGNNRILIYNQIPTTNGAAADVVIGQENFINLLQSCAASNFSVPIAAVSDGGTLYVSDGDNRRVLGFQPGVSMVSGVVNGASFSTLPQTAACDVVLLQPPVAPGGMAAIFGSNLADTPQAAAGLPLPHQLGGVKVKFNGIEAPLFYVSPNQLNVQVPYGLTGYSASMVIERTTGGVTKTSAAVPVGVANGAPGVFTLSGSGTGRGAITHADYSLVTDDNPATSGETLIAWGTGLGTADQPLTEGEAAQFASSGSVSVGGVVVAGQTVSIVIDGRVYSYTAATGDVISNIVSSLAALIDASDPEVSSTSDSDNSLVNLKARIAGDQGNDISYTTFVSDGSSLSSSAGGGNVVPGTITFSGTPQPGQTIVVSLLSTTFIYTVASGDTAADVVRRLAALIDGDPNVAAAADTSTLTISLTLDDPNSGLSIPFGVTVSKPGVGIVGIPSGSLVPGNVALVGVVTAGQVVSVTLQGSKYSYTTTSSDTLASVVTNLANLISNDPNVSATADTANATINLALKTARLSITYIVSVAALDALQIDNGGTGAVPATLTVTGAPKAGQVVTVFLGGTRYTYTVKTGDTPEAVATKIGGLLAADPRVSVSISGAAIDVELASGANDLQVSAGGATAVPATITVSGTPRAGQVITLKIATATYRYTVVTGDTASSVATAIGNLLANDVNVTATVADNTVKLALKKATATVSLDTSLSVPLTEVVTSPATFDAITGSQHFVAGIGHATNTVSAFIGETLPAVPGDILFFGTPDRGQTVTVTLADTTTYTYTTVDNDTLANVVTKLAATINADPNVAAAADTTGERILLSMKDATAKTKIGFRVKVDPAGTATLLPVARSTTTTDSTSASVVFAGPVKGAAGLDQINFTVPSTATENADTKVTFVQNLIVFGSVTNNNIYSAPVTFPVVPLLTVATSAATVPATLTLSGTILAGEVITVKLASVSYTYRVTSGDTLETIATKLAAILNADVNVGATASGATVSLTAKSGTTGIAVAVSVSRY
jgi:uncharacterized protein (TIGR03437 family)